MTAKLPADWPAPENSQDGSAPAQRALLIADMIAAPTAGRNRGGPDQELCRLMENPAAVYEFLHLNRAADDQQEKLRSPASPARARIASVLLPFRSSLGLRAGTASTANGRHRRPQVPATKRLRTADLSIQPPGAAPQKALPFDPSPEDIRQAIDGSGFDAIETTNMPSGRENVPPVWGDAALWWALALPPAIAIAIWLLLF